MIPTILIADSDNSSIEQLMDILGDEGYQSSRVSSGKDAIRQIRKDDIDVAIIDTRLSDMEGHKIIPIIKDISRRIRVIVTTAEHSEEMEREVRQKEVVYYAIKPGDYPLIKDAVRSAVKGSLREKQLYRC
jgi:DNA-binding NtrC family response regulator